MAVYEIIIKDETNGEHQTPNNTPSPKPKPKPSPNNTPDDSGDDFSLKVIAKMSYDLANQLVVSKIGEITRDSLLQQKINTITSIGSMAMSFAISPVLGAVNFATTTASSFIDYSLQIQKQNIVNSQMLQRAGYINRSRN